MPQFPVTPTRARTLEKIPDYSVTMEVAPEVVSVHYDGKELARSARALLVRETRHADVYYLPREDVDMASLVQTGHTTYCPFKGHATYWTLYKDGTEEANIVWCYEDPYPEVAGLKDYLSFYADRTQIRLG